MIYTANMHEQRTPFGQETYSEVVKHLQDGRIEEAVDTVQELLQLERRVAQEIVNEIAGLEKTPHSPLNCDAQLTSPPKHGVREYEDRFEIIRKEPVIINTCEDGLEIKEVTTQRFPVDSTEQLTEILQAIEITVEDVLSGY